MSNNVDPDGTAHLDLRCLQQPIIIDCGSERDNDSNTDGSYTILIWTR